MQTDFFERLHAHRERKETAFAKAFRVATHASPTALDYLLHDSEAEADSMGVFLSCAI